MFCLAASSLGNKAAVAEKQQQLKKENKDLLKQVAKLKKQAAKAARSPPSTGDKDKDHDRALDVRSHNTILNSHQRVFSINRIHIFLYFSPGTP